MIKTPLSIALGGAFWTPGATIIGSSSKNLTQLIKSLFSVGEQGFAYDPNDLATLYQDAAGIIPVTAAGQPVGLMKDKSGRNNHAYQSASASRPILQRNATTGAYYLVFDGADDFLQTNNIDFTATDKVSLFAGIRKLSDAATGVLCELGVGPDQAKFVLFAPASLGVNKYNFRSFGTLGDSTGTTNLGQAVLNAPHSAVLTAKGQISADLCSLTVNASLTVHALSPEQGSGNYSNAPLYIGRRAGTSIPFNGHLYGLIGIGRLTSASETIALEKAIAKNTGVTL